jgi:hypothetical protein
MGRECRETAGSTLTRHLSILVWKEKEKKKINLLFSLNPLQAPMGL